VVSGCLGGTSVNQTHTPTSCIAYPGGWRAIDTHSITYPITDGVCWVIVQKDRTGNITGPDAVAYTRVPNSHYLFNCTAVSQPQTPANAAFLMQVTLTASAITAVTDLRVRSPVTIVSLTQRDPEPPTEQGWGPSATITSTQATIHSTVFTLPRTAPVLPTVIVTVVAPSTVVTTFRLKIDGTLLATGFTGGGIAAVVTLTGLAPSLTAGSHTLTVTANTGVLGDTSLVSEGNTSLIAF
jgi:hypothetical protein